METIKDIVREMRRYVDEQERMSFYDLRNLATENLRIFADRIEAANKREVADALDTGAFVAAAACKVDVSKTETTTVESTCKDTLSVEACNGLQDSCKQTLQGNVAKMREALVGIREDLWDLMGSASESCRESLSCKISATIRTALSAPPRNCDLYANPKEAGEAFISEACENPCGNCTVSDNCHNPLIHECGIKWLFAEAKGGAK